jgi:hypothetical protein
MQMEAVVEAVVEIDENERFWVGGGFGRRGLLPNDRGSYTTTDGSMSWKSLEECGSDLALLGRGWRYEDDSNFTPATKWMYAIDFRVESIKNAKPDRGMMHWVRFRRLYRTKIFHPDDLVPRSVSEKCSSVDSSATDSLSNLILDILAYCTLLHSPSGLTDSVVLPLKDRIINIAISQGQQQSQAATPQSSAATDVYNDDAFYKLDQLRKKLENFVEEERARTIMSRLLKSVEFSFHQRGERSEFKERRNIVTNRCLVAKERDEIATLAVKKLDNHYQLHCDQPDCGMQCRFCQVDCPNEGCPSIMSQMYLEQHQTSCPYKMITCECGDSFPRNRSAVHLAQACRRRTVECPFHKIGCVKIVKACDLEKHIQEDATAHLLLAVDRMSEHQDVIRALHAKAAAMEAENNTLKQAFEQHEKESKSLISGLESKLSTTSKELAALSATCKKEFRKPASLRS